MNNNIGSEKFKCLRQFKHIVFCFPHANSLGIVRSIAKEGLKPIVVCIAPQKMDSGFFHSKYLKECHRFTSPLDGFEFILKEFGNDGHKNFLYLMPDFGVRICDEHYDDIKDKFYFFNCGGGQIH